MKRPPSLQIRAHSMGRGFTAVELLMALAIFAIGATGVLALQVVASRANTHAKDLATATQLARSWQDKLAMDALLWKDQNALTINLTTWVQQVNVLNNQWFLPGNDPANTFGPATDAHGAFVDATANPAQAYFCAHVRLTRLLPQNTGAQALRSEVRVFWPKGPQAWNGGNPYCVAGAVNAVGAATAQFNFVYQTTIIRETPEL